MAAATPAVGGSTDTIQVVKVTPPPKASSEAGSDSDIPESSSYGESDKPDGDLTLASPDVKDIWSNAQAWLCDAGS